MKSATEYFLDEKHHYEDFSSKNVETVEIPSWKIFKIMQQYAEYYHAEKIKEEQSDVR